MAYYTALINAWNSGTTLPSGVVGTAFSAGDSAAQKLVKINAWTVTGVVPTSLTVTGAQLANCINWTEFSALTAQQQSNLLALCNNTGPLLGGSGNTAFLVDGMFLAYFSHTGPTIAALTALAQSLVVPWWQNSGYPAPFTNADISLAGLDGSTWQILMATPTIDQTNGNISTSVAFQNAGATVFTRQAIGNLSTVSVQAWALAVLQNYLNNTVSITSLATTPINVTS